MKNSKRLKSDLDALKRDFISLQFYIEQIHSAPKNADRNSFVSWDRSFSVNLNHARTLMRNIDYALKTKFSEIDKELVANIRANTQNVLLSGLETINDPTPTMKRQGQEAVSPQKTFNAFVKKSIREQSKINDNKRKVTQPNLRKTGNREPS